jgi:hypothetical protein
MGVRHLTVSGSERGRGSMQASEIRWVYRPPKSRRSPDAGATVFGVSAADQDGRVEVILANGTRVTAVPGDLVAEPTQ